MRWLDEGGVIQAARGEEYDREAAMLDGNREMDLCCLMSNGGTAVLRDRETRWRYRRRLSMQGENLLRRDWRAQWTPLPSNPSNWGKFSNWANGVSSNTARNELDHIASGRMQGLG